MLLLISSLEYVKRTYNSGESPHYPSPHLHKTPQDVRHVPFGLLLEEKHTWLKT